MRDVRDVREMTERQLDEEIREAFAEIWANGFGHPNYAMFPQMIAALCDEQQRRLSALRAEVERLKGEAAVMRELCEAVEPMIEAFGATLEFHNPWEAEYAERKVMDYRVMKDKK